jgi:hypothetical protein
MTCQTRLLRLSRSHAISRYQPQASSAQCWPRAVMRPASLRGIFSACWRTRPPYAPKARTLRARMVAPAPTVQAHRSRLPARGRPCFPIPRGLSAPKIHSLSRGHTSVSLSSLPRITACRARAPRTRALTARDYPTGKTARRPAHFRVCACRFAPGISWWLAIGLCQSRG